MSLVWPADLPQYFDEDGFGEAFGDGRIESQTDYGPGKSRRRFTTNWRPIQGNVRCDDEQAEKLVEFYLVDTGGGVLDFLWKTPVLQEDARFRFRGTPPKLMYRSGEEFIFSIQLWQKAIFAGFRFDADDMSFDSTLHSFDESHRY